MAWKSKDAERTPSDVPFVVANDPSKVSTAIGWLRLFSVSRSTCKKAYDAAGERVATKGATQVCVLFSLFSLVLTRAHFTQFHKVV